MASPFDVRSAILRRLESDLIGPFAPTEVLEAERVRPSDVYLSGILWPVGERMSGEDDDGSGGDDEEDESNSTATVVGMQRPCTMGISITISPAADAKVLVEIAFATYVRSSAEHRDGRVLQRWTRLPWSFRENVDLALWNGKSKRLGSGSDLRPHVDVHFRSLPTDAGALTTITLINRTKASDSTQDEIDELALFQTELRVAAQPGAAIVPRPYVHASKDPEGPSNSLLYRECLEFGAGHQCSVQWESDGRQAKAVWSSWLPVAEVPAYKEDGDDMFAPLLASGCLDAQKLAGASSAELDALLKQLPGAYENWIRQQERESRRLETEAHIHAARDHLARCREVRSRIEAGIHALQADPRMRRAFQLANEAMALQHSWKRDPDGSFLGPLRWRPFQLGFILLAAASTCSATAEDREVLDLLWFPTGGGKTEAYLTLIAMVSFYRRLSSKPADGGQGNAALMRYTLRLLTAQQFERAAAMMLASNVLRMRDQNDLGEVPFSIGLWVGKDATPNWFRDAVAARGRAGAASAEQLDACPCCGSKVRWNYDINAERVNPFCEHSGCLLGPEFGLWPVYTVDQDIYRVCPTLLIGTVDKFAQLPFKPEIRTLFGFGTQRATDLIIQDELHLISGPLGTVTGLYETAFDWLLRKGIRRPKVIGSTATIRRADEQVRALFDRKSCLFPPAGISYRNSGFAVVHPTKPGRLYVGVTTAGRSAKFALQAVAGSLLQAASSAGGFSGKERDGYSTLLVYFNSLRELGGAIIQMLDDVPDSIALYAGRRGEQPRALGLPQELTSRVSQREIVEILSSLKRTVEDSDAVDVVLATNMVSVGVDVPRLGLMMVNGQPKTRSEYIQSTSRVGRSKSPGLVVSVLNAAKARDRSHYETFPSWHATLYRDVEATSVTPFAPRARDRGLRAVLVAMVRHGIAGMDRSPDLANARDEDLIAVVEEIERRVASLDAREQAAVAHELNTWLADWEALRPEVYENRYKKMRVLLQRAEDYAKRVAAGRLPGLAWPLMNTMRSVEPSSRFRLAEVLRDPTAAAPVASPANSTESRGQPRWRR